MKIKNLLLGLLIITTGAMLAQDCVSRTNRYELAPSVVTIYPCNSIELSKQINMSIVVDSIYKNERIYRINCLTEKPNPAPVYFAELVSGEIMFLFPDFLSDDKTYSEVELLPKELEFFKKNQVRTVGVFWDKIDPDKHYKAPCNNYFADFIARY